MLVGTSETVCTLSICMIKGTEGKDLDLKIRQWVAGVTDGDGNLYISGKGYVEYSVVMEPRDIACLYKLKDRYGVRTRYIHSASFDRDPVDMKSFLLWALGRYRGVRTVYCSSFIPSLHRLFCIWLRYS